MSVLLFWVFLIPVLIKNKIKRNNWVNEKENHEIRVNETKNSLPAWKFTEKRLLRKFFPVYLKFVLKYFFFFSSEFSRQDGIFFIWCGSFKMHSDLTVFRTLRIKCVFFFPLVFSSLNEHVSLRQPFYFKVKIVHNFNEM